MIKSSAFDPSKRLDLYFRINRDGAKRLTFLDSADDPYDITAIGFEFFIKEYPGAKQKVISLTIGAGLEIPAYEVNILDIEVEASTTILNEGEYYWELYLTDQKKTWLNGKAFFSNREFDGVRNYTETITSMTDIGEVIQITISDSPGSGSTSATVWNFASNANAFPLASTQGKIYVAEDDHGSPGDADYVSAQSLMIAKVAGATSFSQYFIKP